MRHETIEKSLNLMMVLIVLAISIGGLIEIVPLMMSSDATEPDEGISVYSPLRLPALFANKAHSATRPKW